MSKSEGLKAKTVSRFDINQKVYFLHTKDLFCNYKLSIFAMSKRRRPNIIKQLAK